MFWSQFSLGKLASNTPLSYTQTIDNNVAAIGKLPNLSQGAIAANSAAQTIAKALADAVTNAYRRCEVNLIVKKSNDAVEELTADLKKVVTVEYVGILSNESAVQDIYYQGPIAAAGKSERLALIAVQRQYDSDAAALHLKLSAAEAYGKVMDNLGSLHAKLKTQADKKGSLKEIAQQIGPDIAHLKDSISQLQTRSK